VVDSFGGVEISGEMPKAIELAYQMERQIGAKKDKYTKAFFGWIKFELPQSKIDEVKKAVDKNDKIIRFLIIKTVREDTMAVKKVAARSGEGPAYKKTSDPVKSERPAMSEAEMDKTIEELVIQ
jgi:ribosomal protein S6